MISSSEEQTFRVAKELAGSLSRPAHVLLYGDLGAGKTAFTRGLAAGFGFQDIHEVTSPTFTLVNRYDSSHQGGGPIYHIDLYRIETGRLEGLGLDELFDDPRAVVIIEWAERLGGFETPGAVKVFLEYVDERTRSIDMTGST